MYRSSNIDDERKDFLIGRRDLFLVNSLYDAVVDGDVVAVGHLLEHKRVNPNHVLEEYDAAPLHTATGIATEGIAAQIVQLLLTYGAHPDITTSDGTTPLIIACIFDRSKIARLILKYGGNPLLRDADGLNAIDYASKNSHETLRELVENYNFDWSVLESSDCSFKESEVGKKFTSVFVNDRTAKSNCLQGKQLFFSDIESDTNCIEFVDLNTAFCGSDFEQSVSSGGTFVSVLAVEDVKSSNPDLSVTNAKTSTPNGNYSGQDSPNNSSETYVSDFSYRTDRIKFELARHSINHGPVTASTKKVYYNLIKKVIKGKRKGPFDIDELSTFPEVLRSTITGNFRELVCKWNHLEELLSKNFKNTNIVWRGGKEKQFFTYLLLDPFVTNNLASRKEEISESELWKTFILSIFYVGKGKNSRPFSHLYEALRNNFKKTVSKKILRIQNIWDNSAGVVCLHVFHNVICAEAHTREAAMIEALGLSNLTNIQSGESYGIVKNWSSKQKQQLGVVLLSRALQIYLAEGERQIFQSDLK